MSKQTNDIKINIRQWTEVGTASKFCSIENPTSVPMIFRVGNSEPTSQFGHRLVRQDIPAGTKVWVKASSGRNGTNESTVLVTE